MRNVSLKPKHFASLANAYEHGARRWRRFSMIRLLRWTEQNEAKLVYRNHAYYAVIPTTDLMVDSVRRKIPLGVNYLINEEP
jgi:hypothetical protein